MIKLVKVPEWVYMNCIYDKKIGSKLTEILRNISEWESSGKIRYQFDIDENMDIINKNNLMNLPPASVLEDINNSKEIEQPIFPTKIDSIDYIMTININHDIINDMMFFINYILRNMTDPLTGARNPEITKFYINHDDNFYFSSPNRFFGEDILSAFFDSSIYKSVSDDIAANDEYICIKLKIKNVIISQHDKVTNPNNAIKILDKMINKKDNIMNDSLILIDIASELGLGFNRESIRLINDNINLGQIKYKIYKEDDFVYIEIKYSSRKIEISSIFDIIYQSELTLDIVDSINDTIKVPFRPFRSAAFVFQTNPNMKTFICKIHTISYDSEYATIKFIASEK